jgi:biopolymer transport protein ExbB
LKQPTANFRQQIVDSLTKGDFKGAAAISQNAKDSSLGRVVSIGCELRANGAGEEEIQARMDERLNNEISSIDRRTGFLAMSGNVATLLGLLGTIAGMIHSFAAVANASPIDRATMLSKGISEAMNCTAFGLIVAIPALVAFAYFQNKTDRSVTALTEGTTEIYHDLMFLTENSRPAQPTARRENGVSRSTTPTLSV